jgi:hypothetical protein
MKSLILASSIFLFSFMAFNVQAMPINILEGASVSLNGEFFTGGWSGGDVPVDVQARADSLVDGVFLPRSHQWNQDTVWWDAASMPANKNNSIVIDLNEMYYIDSFIVQADDNDAYTLEYWNGSNWQFAMDIANYDNYGWGLQTRPNPYDVTEQTPAFANALLTDKLRFSGNYYNGDRLYAVSEIQAFGYAAEMNVPEPSSILLMGVGLIGFATRKKLMKTAI